MMGIEFKSLVSRQSVNLDRHFIAVDVMTILDPVKSLVNHELYDMVQSALENKLSAEELAGLKIILDKRFKRW